MQTTDRTKTLLGFLDVDPDDTFSRFALAMEYRKLGDSVSCIRELEEVLQRDADYVGAYYHIGRQYMEQDAFEKALDFFQTGLEAAQRVGDSNAARELREAVAEVNLELD